MTYRTTPWTRLPPRCANTLAVFANLSVQGDPVTATCDVVQSITQPCGRVASLINSPCRLRQGGRVGLRPPRHAARWSLHHLKRLKYPRLHHAPARNLHH